MKYKGGKRNVKYFLKPKERDVERELEDMSEIKRETRKRQWGKGENQQIEWNGN